jgi:hypothetical protein
VTGEVLRPRVRRWGELKPEPVTRVLVPHTPIVDVSDKYQITVKIPLFSFDAPRLMWAIINAVGDNYFSSVGEIGLRYYANELRHHDPQAAEELLAAIGDNDVKLGQNLHKLEGVEFWGYRLVKLPKKERNITLWQVRKGCPTST